jgi:hypothetical protein
VKKFLALAIKVVVAHTVTYFIVGALAYQVLTKTLYEGSDPIFARFMRTPADPDLWRPVMLWFMPAQVLRGLLMAVALYPFYDTLLAWSIRKRFLSLTGLYLIFGYWASAVAAPGTIDGLVYLRPEFTVPTHLIVQPEIILQGAALAWWVARWMGRKHAEQMLNHAGKRSD